MGLTTELLRVYEAHELGRDGYPLAWHSDVKYLVRELAGHRCIRCGHPYPPGIAQQFSRGEWTPCDELCTHGGPLSASSPDAPWAQDYDDADALKVARHHLEIIDGRGWVEARYRILTVHHLNGDKADRRWWNLLALCQRCHLQVQGKVNPLRPWPWDLLARQVLTELDRVLSGPQRMPL